MAAVQKLLIVIIEDDADSAFLLQRLLAKSRLSYETIHLGDGEKALEFFGSRLMPPRSVSAPDLILLDIKMPKINGFEVLEWIRSRAKLAVPVIVMSTSDDPSDQQRALALGADAFVSKFPAPIEFQKLLLKLLQTSETLPAS